MDGMIALAYANRLYNLAEGPQGPQGEPGGGAVGTVADAYSSSKTYAVGDYAIHNEELYICISAITTAEAFTAAHWTQVVLGDDVSDLRNDFDNFSVFTKGTGVDSAILVESEGESPVASGERSVAIGSRSNASGDCSFAGGSHATINGTTYVPTASGTNSFAYGAGALASGVSSFAFGAHNSAVGVATATGNASVSMGLACKATNTGSVALGTANNASGSASVALGLMNNAKEAGQMAIGRYNADEPTAKFIVGSGSSSSDRVNCFSAGVNANSEFYIKVGSVELTATQLTALLALLTQ